jgi:hypothetical protein
VFGLVSERLCRLVDHSVCAKLAHILDFVTCAYYPNHVQIVQLA